MGTRRVLRLLLLPLAVLAIVLVSSTTVPVATALPAPAAPAAAMGPVCGDGIPCPPDCTASSCVGKDPDNQGCSAGASSAEEQWIPGLSATLTIRSSGACQARWARLHWLTSGDSCKMSGVAIQHRRKVSGSWVNGDVQDAVRGLQAFCSDGRYWTKMVWGGSAQYRYRTAEGYMASGCSADCVRYRWSDWSAWK